MGTSMNALSILERLRSVPSVAVAFLVNFWLRNLKNMWEKGAEQSRFPCITFCEVLVPDAEPPFLRLANVEIPNNHPMTFGTTWPVKSDATQPFTKVSQEKVGLKVHVDDHQNAFTRLYSHG